MISLASILVKVYIDKKCNCKALGNNCLPLFGVKEDIARLKNGNPTYSPKELVNLVLVQHQINLVGKI